MEKAEPDSSQLEKSRSLITTKMVKNQNGSPREAVVFSALQIFAFCYLNQMALLQEGN